MNKYLLAYDVYERHRKVASLIGKHDTVLDVGGELNHLSLFCTPKKLVVANLESGDVIIKKKKLPFSKGSFDIVTSIDVLEHIPKKDRKGFIDQLLSIASKKVILSFPIGTKEHIQYEKELKKTLKIKGEHVKYLLEHVKHGLPTREEVLSLTKGKSRKISFSGNLNASKYLFKLFVFDPKIPIVRKTIYFLKKIFYLLTNELIYQLLIDKKYSAKINRVYVVMKKQD